MNAFTALEGGEGRRRPALRVLMVCMGNICRSPMAQGMLEWRLQTAGLADRVEVDSAGTGDWHRGATPDPRAMAAAARRGVDLGAQRARVVEDGDFVAFDLILAMDRDNLAALRSRCPAALQAKLRLLMDYAPGVMHREIPDPYFARGEGFERALNMIELATEGLLDELEERLGDR